MKQLCERVIILGLDGAGNAVKDAVTPNIDKLFSKGAATYSAKTSFPSISGECWGSLFHGVAADKHKLTNDVADYEYYPEDSIYPSFMKLAREKWPECTLASFSCWGPINHGIIEQSCKCHLESACDSELVPSIVDYISSNDAKILFVQMDDVDHAGHGKGYWTKEYYEQIGRSDTLIGQILNALSERKMLEDSLVIICADHGGGGDDGPTSHGSNHPKDMTIFWGCSGPGIIKGSKIAGEMNIMDTAAVVAYALGIDRPQEWDAKIPAGIFEA